MAEQIDATKAAGLFKSYDIRGIAPEELSPELAYRIGRALVLELGVDVVAVGRDMRVTGPLLSSSLIDGIRDQGADVTDLGLVSTDALYFAVGKFGFPAGVMITASHNPAEYNGFKLCREDARAVSLEDGIEQIRDRVLGDDFPPLADEPRRPDREGCDSGVRRARPGHGRCLGDQAAQGRDRRRQRHGRQDGAGRRSSRFRLR